MLSDSGPVKNSGKIVTTLLHSTRRSVEQSDGGIDPQRALVAIDLGDDAIVRHEHGAVAALHVEREPLRQLVVIRHHANWFPTLEQDAHSGQLVQIDLVIASRSGVLR